MKALESLSYITISWSGRGTGWIFFLLFPFTNWVVFEPSLGWGGTEVVREELRKTGVFKLF